MVTRNVNNLLFALANLPFVLAGGVLAVFASGGLLSLGAMVGFVTLFVHYSQVINLLGATWEAGAPQRYAEGRSDVYPVASRR